MISAFLEDELLWNPEKAQDVDQELREISKNLEQYNPAAANLSFRPNSQWGEIVVRLSQEATSSVRQGEGGPWDSLNSRLGIEVDRIEWLLDGGSCSLHFNEPLNPRRLVELYEGLPGVESASVNGIAYTPRGPGSSGIFPMEQKSRRTYIVVYEKREANGRTLNTEYWHFSAGRGAVVLLEYWNQAPGGPLVPWMATVEKARQYARTY